MLPEPVNALQKIDQNALYAQVGQSVQRLRRARKLTQQALGEKVRLSRTSITNIEKGRQKVLVHTLAELAQVLNASVAELMPRADETNNGLEQRISHLPEKTEKEFIQLIMETKPRKQKRL